MDNYIFGMKAELTGNFAVNDFDEKTAQLGDNYNPYNKAFFNLPENMTWAKDQGRITSIPSPYARMHITDLSFQESNCGIGVVADHLRKNITLSADYLRAMSHCLDIFELMFHADEFNLTELGITLHKLNLLSTKTIDPAEKEVLYAPDGKLNQLGLYIQTLDLYRDAYLEAIRRRNVPGFRFDFTSLYILKYKGKTFASTSPFTGFFAKADCDLDSANIKINGRKILSADPSTWRNLKQRDKAFREFLYLLFKDYGLKDVYQNLFLSLKDSFESMELTALDQRRFDADAGYLKFNIPTKGLQQLPVEEDSVYIRPDGLDCSYLKFLLYLQEPVDLTISKEEYGLDVAERRFNGEHMKWIGVNDILSDALFILPYDVNENYTVIPYRDKAGDNQLYNRCLVPVKREALNYFTIEQLVSNITIERLPDGMTYSVALKVVLANNNTIVLRKEYRVSGAKFPDGLVISGAEMKPFAFGVYPFVKSNIDLNIYKVLFYNVFEKPYVLDFYYREGKQMVKFLERNHSHNKTNDILLNQNEFPVNCEYHHLEGMEGFEFAELTLDEKYTSLIIPKLRTVHNLPDSVNVAIDLGTSNTYIAYNVNFAGTDQVEIDEIKTHHQENNAEWNELTFMNKRCAKVDLPTSAADCNRDDLILKLSDRANDQASAEFLDHQLCEFIPSRIDPSSEEDYHFPIPSVLNFLRINGERREVAEANPLINSAIPFAYYERGTRHGIQRNYYDRIYDGNQFKWFNRRNDEGDYKTNDIAKMAFNAFVHELMFIVRCHILSRGYSLQNVQIYWSYPLSFSSVLVKDYKTAWTEAYRALITRNNNAEEHVHYTNESRSPIYDCILPTAADHLTLLVDMGGGSTDIIGYQDFKPLFITSFGFAGNALYLDSQLNSLSQSDMSQTILYRYISQSPLFADSKSQSNGLEVRKISKDAPISTLMNYGFTKARGEFEGIFNNAAPKFMLMLHNSALMYHIAQLCYIKSSEEMPVDIYLTGNGSKQLKLNSEYKKMIRDIFAYVYSRGVEDADTIKKIKEDASRVNIISPNNPKAATVRGMLKGVQKKIALDEDSVSGSEVMVGDAETILPRSEYGALLNANPTEGLRQNIQDYVDMFYSVVYTTPVPKITKDEFLKAVEYVKSNRRLNVGDGALITDSLFLQYIALVMEKLSVQLAQK